MRKLRKNDVVMVQHGKDRGKRGKILHMLPKQEAALVERLNLLKHFDRRSQANQAGGIIEREHPIALAKLALVCSRCNRPARVGFKVSSTNDGGVSKQRICKRCGEVIVNA